MSATVFLSAVTDEFRFYRDTLRSSLTRHNVEVKVQEDFKDYGEGTLDGLDVLISNCDVVVHLVGEMTGAEADADHEQGPLLSKYSDLATKFAPLGAALAAGERLTYTQWEAWLALYHGKKLLIAEAAQQAPRAEKGFALTKASRDAEAKHLACLAAVKRFPGCHFTDPDNLAVYVFSSGILDLLAEDIARKKGVPLASLQAVLVKLGEAEVPIENIPERLGAKADELVELRTQLARLTNERPASWR
jgi:hypothetical protein